jgi:TRAP-type C4-dicarboxylate transport system permease small subunit
MENIKGSLNRKEYFNLLVISLNNIGCSLILVLMILTSIDVCGRLFFNSPLIGTTELTQSAVVAIAFLQIPYVQMINRHLSVTILYDKMNSKGKRIVDIFSSIIGIVVFALLVFSGWKLLVQGIKVREYEGYTEFRLPTYYVRSIIVLCSGINIIVYTKQLISKFTKTNEMGGN